MHITFSATVGIVVAILMGIVVMWGADLIGGPPALPIPDKNFDQGPDRLHVLLVATDHAVTMLTTLALGLVVLVGFCLKLAEGRHSAINAWDRLAGAGFVCALFASVFFGVASRRLAFELTSSGYSDWSWVQDTINGQALLLGVDAVFGFYLAARSLERMRWPANVTDSTLQGPIPPTVPSSLDANSSNSRPAAPGLIEKQAAAVVAKPKRKGGAPNA